MNGYAPAWSRSSSGARKKNSLASAPDSMMTGRPARSNRPTSPHSARTRRISPIGSRRSSSRCASPETSRGSSKVMGSPRCLGGSRRLRDRRPRFLPEGIAAPQAGFRQRQVGPARHGHDGHDGGGDVRGPQEVRVPGQAPADPVVQHRLHCRGLPARCPSPSCVGPGRTTETRTPVPSSSICMARAMPSTPCLAAT